MRYKDTTDPATYQQLKPVFTNPDFMSDLKRSEQIRFKIIGFYHSFVGPEWSSAGHEEGDCFHHIHMACGGHARIRHKGEDFDLHGGSAYFLSGNSPVVRVTANQYEAYVLKFRCESSRGTDLLLDWPERRPLSLGPWNRELWETRWKDGPARCNAYLALHGQLALWLALGFPDLDEIIARHHQMFSRYERVLEVLEGQLGADLRIQELAKEHGTSLHAFSMAFTRDTGISPKAYLNRRLNQQACHLMAGTNHPVKEVARELGFTDEYYFSRFFNKMNGMPPGKYRQIFFDA